MNNETSVIESDGTCCINGACIKIPNVRLTALIASGANGVVFAGVHRFLERTVAVKVWAKLRALDTRNKFTQGIDEARKADKISAGRAVVPIHDAGEAGGHFYATMDYYPSITLDDWLTKHSPDLGRRRELSGALVNEVVTISSEGIHHGDLHTRNVLISVDHAHMIYPNFRIIDFGTSRFARTKRRSVERHWRVFSQTIDRLISPFDCRSLHVEAMPLQEDPKIIGQWFHYALDTIVRVLIHCGATWLSNPLSERGIDDYFVDPQDIEMTKRLIESGRLSMTRDALGSGPEYRNYTRTDPPEWGRTASDEYWESIRRKYYSGAKRIE